MQDPFSTVSLDRLGGIASVPAPFSIPLSPEFILRIKEALEECPHWPMQRRPFQSDCFGGPARGACLGVSCAASGPFVQRERTNKCAKLVHAVLDGVASVLPAGIRLRCSSVQVNIDSMSDVHKDKGNFGPSAAIIVGDFSHGGALIATGSRLPSKDAVSFFNGTEDHSSERFSGGRRTSFIVFLHDRAKELECDMPYLHHLGFSLSPGIGHATSSRPTSAGPGPVAPDAPHSQLLLVSAFSGIDCAALALRTLNVPVDAHVCFEIDPECVAVSSFHFKKAVVLGNLFDYKPADLLKSFSEACGLTGSVNLSNWNALWCAGPPCPDASPIRSSRGPGLDGAEGRKFKDHAELMFACAPAFRTFNFLVEYVRPRSSAMTQQLDKIMGAQGFIANPKTRGGISRPRLWWSSSICPSSTPGCFTSTPSGPEFVLSFPPFDFACIEPPGCFVHPSIANGTESFCCLTTPSPNAGGRAAPHGAAQRLPAHVMQRWEDSGRAAAPWHFQDFNLLWSNKDGTGSWQHLSADMMELLHGLPVGWTKAAGACDHARRRMLANGWHVGVAADILMAMLSPRLRDIPKKLSNWGGSRLDMLRVLYSSMKPRYGVGDGQRRNGEDALQDFNDPFLHMEAATKAPHPDFLPTRPTPQFCWAAEMQTELNEFLPTFRKEIVSEILELVEDKKEENVTFVSSLPPHVQYVYYGGGALEYPSINLLAVKELLDIIHYPDEALFNDLCNGFPVTGTTSGSPWWTPTSPEPPSLPDESLEDSNAAFWQENPPQHADPHYATLLAELLEERARGRVIGPLQAPPEWGFKACGIRAELVPAEFRHLVDIADAEPEPLSQPAGSYAGAPLFPIVQKEADGADRIRRGDDWKRSTHNAFCVTSSAPAHDDLDRHVTNIRHLAAIHGPRVPLHGWLHDHDGAYRQLPAEQPSLMLAVLMTPDGPVVFQHTVLNFGSKGSVWGYNRTGDAIVAIASYIAFLTCGHYVDDYAGFEPARTALSAFTSFEEINGALGFRVKQKKKQEPSDEVELLGAHVSLELKRALLSPRPARVTAFNLTASLVLQKQELSPHLAAAMAGKCGVLTATCAGQVGRAATKALFTRAHDTRYVMLPSIRDSLLSLMNLFSWAPPRSVPYAVPDRCVNIYVDAFVTVHNRRRRAQELSENDLLWIANQNGHLHNGMGGLLLPLHGQPVYFHVELPPRTVREMASSEAFIFALEALAPILASLFLQKFIDGHHVFWEDNNSARGALVRGHTGLPLVNGLIGLFWEIAALRGTAPWLRRVSSEDNASDSVSRKDFRLAESLGARRLHPPEGWWDRLAAHAAMAPRTRDATVALLNALEAA